MVAVLESPQRIARLTAVADALACIDRLVAPVAPAGVDLAAAVGLTLAADVTPAGARPAVALAGRDGWALAGEDTADAGAYAPAILARPPVRVDSGEALPEGSDAVAEVDLVRKIANRWEALASVVPGDGVWPAGVDAGASEIVRPAGRVLRMTDIAALAALGLATVSVRRPRVRLAAARRDRILDTVLHCLAGLARGDGGAPDVAPSTTGLDAVLSGAGAGADLIVIAGGTGTGACDRSVEMLRRLGRLEFHGLALAPGTTSGFGVAGGTPVLIVPGRVDAAIAAWLVLGRRVMARLAACSEDEPVLPCRLSRKLSSSLGLSELVLLRRDDGAVAPLASGTLPLSALAQADGFTIVPPDSEGWPAGAHVPMRLLP